MKCSKMSQSASVNAYSDGAVMVQRWCSDGTVMVRTVERFTVSSSCEGTLLISCITPRHPPSAVSNGAHNIHRECVPVRRSTSGSKRGCDLTSTKLMRAFVSKATMYSIPRGLAWPWVFKKSESTSAMVLREIEEPVAWDWSLNACH